MADTALKDMVLGLIAETKRERSTRRRTRPKGTSPQPPGTAPPDPKRFAQSRAFPDPWRRASVVLMVTYTTCNSCGHESTCWEPHLYLETFNRSANPCRHLERIESYGGRWAEIYGKLPKRIEPRLRTSDTCPLCFGLADNGADGPLYSSVGPQQPDLFHNLPEIAT